MSGPGSAYLWHSLLGEVAFTADGPGPIPVYLESSGVGIIKDGGTTSEHVYFGFGDAWVYNSSPDGTGSTLPDLYIIPEPATLTLIGLLGLTIRRR